MKNDPVDKLIKQSLQTPSDDFTDVLMQRIAKEKPIRFLFGHVIMFIASILIMLGALVLIGNQSIVRIPLVITRFSLSPISLQIVMVLFVTLALNKFFSLKKISLET